MKNRNFDYHVETNSNDYWIDYADYADSDSSDMAVIDVSNDILVTVCNNNNIDWHSANQYCNNFKSNETNGAKWLQEFANWCNDNINSENCLTILIAISLKLLEIQSLYIQPTIKNGKLSNYHH